MIKMDVAYGEIADALDYGSSEFGQIIDIKTFKKGNKIHVNIEDCGWFTLTITPKKKRKSPSEEP